MKGGLLAARIGVQEAADGFDLFSDVARASALRALEGHVFEHMRDAHDDGSLVTCSTIHPHPHGHAFQLRHGIGNDGQAIGKSGDFNLHVCANLASIKARTRSPSSGSTVTRSIPS